VRFHAWLKKLGHGRIKDGEKRVIKVTTVHGVRSGPFDEKTLIDTNNLGKLAQLER
jgi:hypothetical protein